MKIETRQKLAQDIFKECLEVLEKKGKDYSGSDDCLSNFKRNAERLGLTKYQIMLVYMAKHFDSICNAIKADPESPKAESEPIRGRIVDLINYAVIFYALMEE